MDTDKVTPNKVVKVMVAIPRAGFTMVEAVDNQMEMARYLGIVEGQNEGFEFQIATIGRLFVAKAREEFAEYMLKNDCDYLLMIDDDMICPSDLFFSLYRHDKDIVAPLAFQRRAPFYPVIYKTKNGWDEVEKRSYFSNEIVKTYPKDTLFKCDAVGFGAVLIKRWVIEKMTPPRFMSTSPTGEDILFCYNAREQVGAEIYCDTSVKIAHLGPPLIVDEKVYEEHNDIEEIRDRVGDYKEASNE